MNINTLSDIVCESKQRGLSCLIDPGLPTGMFLDYIESHNDYIDYVKFGWGTALKSKNIVNKISILQEYNIDYFFGGTLFEFSYLIKLLPEFVSFVQDHSCKIIEISDGSIDIPTQEKLEIISKLANEFTVWTEIGYKDSQRSLELPPSKWIEYMRAALDAGSEKVITESRESGTSGICRANGDIRFGLIEDILASDIDLDDIIFEAPTKSLQVYFINKCGPVVNLANIAFPDVISLQTLRCGLRADTLLTVNM